MGLNDLCDQCERLCHARLVPIDETNPEDGELVSDLQGLLYWCFFDRDGTDQLSSADPVTSISSGSVKRTVREQGLANTGLHTHPVLAHHSPQHILAAKASECHLCTLTLGEILQNDSNSQNDSQSPLNSESRLVGIPLLCIKRYSIDLVGFQEEEVVKDPKKALRNSEIKVAFTVLFVNIDDGSTFLYFELEVIGNAPKLGIGLQDLLTHGFRETTIEWIKQWIKACQAEHPDCSKATLIKGTKLPLPTRLLRLRPFSDKTMQVSLVETGSFTVQESLLEYATLSHCWGNKESEMKLTSANREAYASGFDTEQLPRTFKETLNLCRLLGIFYVWIDALCIVQDDPSDWSREAVRMLNAYAGAVVNIAATSSSDCYQGLLVQDNYRTPCQLYTAWAGDDDMNGINVKGFRQDPMFLIDHAPLNKRSWVFQERLLSARTVHFAADQIWLQCRQETIAECSGTATHPIFIWSRSQQSFEKGEWETLVTEYSHTQLSHESDRLAAISGVAEGCLARRGLGPEDYLAGMLRPDLIAQMSWYVDVGHRSGRSGIAPTWSWASTKSGSRARFEIHRLDSPAFTKETQPCLRILNVFLTSDPDTPYNSERCGMLRMRALLASAEFRRGAVDRDLGGSKDARGPGSSVRSNERVFLINQEAFRRYPQNRDGRDKALMKKGDKLLEEYWDNADMKRWTGKAFFLPMSRYQLQVAWSEHEYWPEGTDVFVGLLLLRKDDRPGTYERIGLMEISYPSYQTPRWWNSGDTLDQEDYLESHGNGLYDIEIV